MKAEQALARLGLTLPEPMAPMGAYVPTRQVGDLLFVSGQGPRLDGDLQCRGKVGRDLTVEEGYAAARLVMLNCLSQVKAALGDLDRVAQVVKVLGFVNAPEGFRETPKVLNGASELLLAIYGEAGRHARSAIGVAALPSDIAVEIEMVVQVRPPRVARAGRLRPSPARIPMRKARRPVSRGTRPARPRR
ncbi:MAG: RidA family protein [Deltaproteobacteria bacterium]|nr:RidA family protein [Deltaproteobacteria bacterium]MBI3076202.1 RidA family protein [Deltaproteobacteria bacterium]